MFSAAVRARRHRGRLRSRARRCEETVALTARFGRSTRPNCAGRGAAERSRSGRGTVARRLASDAPLGECLAAHRAALAALVAPDEAGPGLGTLDALFDEAVEAAVGELSAEPADYAALFDSLLAGQAPRPKRGDNPRLAFSACWKRGCSASYLTPARRVG